MATPFVAGVALLMLDANPALSPADVKSTIMSTAIDWGRGGDNRTAARPASTSTTARAGSTPTPPSRPQGQRPPRRPARDAAAHVLLEGTMAGTGTSINFPVVVTTRSSRSRPR